MALATIVSGEKRYELTADDALWAARAAACEAGGRADGTAAVLWTWASLFAKSSYGSFGALVRAHSQPVNPVWRATGDACRPGGSWGARAPGNYFDEPECSVEKLMRRERCRTLEWEEIAPVVRDVVTAFAAGKLPNPVPRAVDFAHTSVRAKAGLKVVKNYGGNVFYTTEQSRAWPSNFVTMMATDGTVVGDAGGGAGPLVVGGVLAALYAAYRTWGRR